MELNFKPIVSATSAALGDDAIVSFVNGLSNTIFKSVTVFINEKMVEANSFFNYSSYVKLLKKLDTLQVARYGPCGYFYDDYNIGGVTSNYVDDTFKKVKMNVEYILMPRIKEGTYPCFPLLLDLSSIDMYLLDGIDVRIRLEMANED